jgi:beta-glucanase (GH16 family)
MVTPGTVEHTGEIDVVEDINGDSQHSGSMHCGYLRTSQNQCQSYGLGSGLVACPGCQLSYHTYSVVIDRRIAGAEMISWYLDGKEFYSVSEANVGDAMWTDALSSPFTIILDVGMGGGYPDSRCNCHAPLTQTTPGASMFVKYVSVSRLAS